MSSLVGDGVALDPVPVSESGAERARLMDAALQVMLQNGFQGASVQDILDRAGLSTRAFYREFRSKDDLLLAMFRTASNADVDGVAERVAEAPDPLAAVHTWIDEMVAMAFDPRRIRRLVIFNAVARQAVGYDEEETGLRTRLMDPLSTALAQGSADGSLPTAEPAPDAEAIFDLVWSVAHPYRRSRGLSRAGATAQVLRFCLPALGVDPAG